MDDKGKKVIDDYVARIVADAPPLSASQKDVIRAAFAGMTAPPRIPDAYIDENFDDLKEANRGRKRN